jgi:hypothetical protein
MGFTAGVILGALVTAAVSAPIVRASASGGEPPSELARVLARLDALEARLTRQVVPAQLLQSGASSEICITRAVTIEGAGEAGSKARLVGEGRLGIEAFGSGGMARAKAKANLDVKLALKGEQAVEFVRCFDTTMLASAPEDRRGEPFVLAAHDERQAPPGGSPVRAARRGRPRDQALSDAVLALAQATGLMNDPTPGLTLLLNGADDLTLLGLLRDGPQGVKSLLAELPMPPRLRARMENPRSVIDELRQLREAGLCDNPDIPAVLQELTAEACQFKDSNPYVEALDRIDAVTQDVQSRVANVQTRAQDIQATANNIRSRLPDPGDSIFK